MGRHYPIWPAAGLGGKLITVVKEAPELDRVRGRQLPGRLAVGSAIPADGEIVKRLDQLVAAREQEVVSQSASVRMSRRGVHGRDQRQEHAAIGGRPRGAELP